MFKYRFGLATILAILILISFGVPIELVRMQLFELEDKSQLWREATLKEAAFQEMASFRNDLKPEKYIDKAIRAIEEKFIREKESRSFNLAGDEFARYLDHELRNNYGLQPLFVCWANDYCRSSGGVLSPELLIESGRRKEFFDFISCFSTREIFEYFSFPDEKPVELMIDRWMIHANNLGFSGVSEYLQSFYRSFLSNYYAVLPPPNQAYKFFVDRFNFQFLYFYPRILIQENQFSGLLAVGILESGIDVAVMQKNCLSGKAGDFYQSRRFLLDKKAGETEQGFSVNDRFVSVEDSGPHELTVLLKNLRRISAKTEIEAEKRLQIKLFRRNKKEFSSYVYWTSMMMRGLLLAVFTFWIRLALFGFNFNTELRRKFVLLMSLVLVPPTIIASFLCEMIAHKERENLLGAARNHLTIKLDYFESLLLEAKNRQMFNNLAIKEKLSRFFQKNNLNGLNLKEFKPLFLFNAENCLIYLQDGSLVNFADYFVSTDPDKLEVGNSAKFLAALGAIENIQGDVARHLRRNELAEGVVGGFFELLDEHSIMGREGLGTPRLIKTSPIFRSQYFLLPDYSSPNLMPLGLVILSHKLRNSFLEILHNSEGFPHRTFSEITPDFSLQLAVGERNSAEFEKIRLCGDEKLADYFSEVFRYAALQGSSGSSMITRGNSTELSAWRIFQDSPLMFAGLCRINDFSRRKSLITLLPMAIFAFSILALVILAEVMNSLFLPPISSLKNAAEKIMQENDFQAKVTIENNDEFDRMGAAFNEMTEGLLQREHLSRFVSGRLLENIVEDNQNLERLSEELEVTVLCSDLRDFTLISETHAPEMVVETLNDYFTEMEPVITSSGGVIDKFVGDAILAVFYPDRCENTVLSAIDAAVKMRQVLHSFNEKRRQRGLFCVENGIGIATGTVISGNIGVVGVHMDFSITGKILRQANELEALSKIANTSRIVLDQISAQRAEDFIIFERVKVEAPECYQLLEIKGGGV